MISEKEAREWYKHYLKSLTEYIKKGGDVADEDTVLRF